MSTEPSDLAYEHVPRFRLPRMPDLRSALADKLVRWGLNLMPEDGNLVKFARYELKLAGWFEPDAFYGEVMGDAVIDMMKLFAREGHSGMSANIAIGLFEKVGRFEPLTPLTGDDDEWNEVGEGTFQNRRCPHVFKNDGKAYDINGRVFREASGACFTNFESRVPVTFPYVPKTEYVDVPVLRD